MLLAGGGKEDQFLPGFGKRNDGEYFMTMDDAHLKVTTQPSVEHTPSDNTSSNPQINIERKSKWVKVVRNISDTAKTCHCQ